MPQETPKKKSKKELVFAAAMKVIGERGYAGASVDEIAKKAGVAKGIVYYYYDSKAALAEQLIKTGLEFLAQKLKAAIPPDATPVEAFYALAHEQVRQVDKRRDFARFLLSEMWREDRAWRETLDGCIERIVSLFREQLIKGQESGDFRCDIDREFYAQMIFATFLAGALNHTVIHPSTDYDAFADGLARYALAGLMKEPPHVEPSR